MERAWWKEAVVYQIYPRSFMDTNGDGIGDIEGIISKLDYLMDLGVDVIWICPIYTSPNVDNGYDISDYYGIMKEFGTMADFHVLLQKVHERKMKLILDLVINHTSDKHPWFIESRKSTINSYRDYYIWKPGKKGLEPNNWESIFGGSAWEFDPITNEYYLHVFSKHQPDLNWENQVVRKSLYKMINWWLEKGIDGFRIDAISHIKKLPGLPNMPNPKRLKYVPSFKGHMNVKGIETFLQELKRETFSQYDILTVGEANGVNIKEAERWVGDGQGPFNLIFQFEHLDLWGKSPSGGLDIKKLKEVMTKWQKGLEGKGWNALFLENHDQPRSVSTWGDDHHFREESAKSLATMYFFMQGTPFIYQGQEIGMTNYQFPSINDYRDVAIKNLYQEEKEKGKSHDEIMKIISKTARDNARTPMQWSDEKNGGFSFGVPWIKVNPNYHSINVRSSMKDQQSIYHYYKKLIQLRKQLPVLIYGKYDLILKKHEQIFAYTRTLEKEKCLILVNLFPNPTDFKVPKGLKNKKWKLILSNYADNHKNKHQNNQLLPYEARVYQIIDE